MLAYLGIAYAPKLKAKGDVTSPVAAAATIAVAFLGGMGSVGLALACAAIIVLILALRDEFHGFVDRLDEKDVKALARFAVIALAILPFLPDQRCGPYDAWNPSKLWWVVVLVTGFSFAGYIANRIFGARTGRSRPRSSAAPIARPRSPSRWPSGWAAVSAEAPSRPESRWPARSCTCA